MMLLIQYVSNKAINTFSEKFSPICRTRESILRNRANRRQLSFNISKFLTGIDYVMMKIVLVDRQTAARDYLESILVQAGHHIAITDQVNETFTLVQAENPDLVIIDPLLNRKSSRTEIEKIKTNRPQTCVFAWTNRSTDLESRDISETDAFFLKNVLMADLIKEVATQYEPVPDSTSYHGSDDNG